MKINIYDVSDPIIVYKNYLNYMKKNNLNINDYPIYLSTNKKKKYMIHNKIENKWIHFGDINYSDYTYHKNNEKRRLYLSRANNIKGEWKIFPLSPNNLSINLLW